MVEHEHEHERQELEQLEPRRRPLLRVRVQRQLLDAVDEHAKRTGENRSAAARDLLCLGLTARGLWPPRER